MVYGQGIMVIDHVFYDTRFGMKKELLPNKCHSEMME
jgi:hypothetical protein